MNINHQNNQNNTSLATYNKMINMQQAIANLRVRDKRSIFLLMRTADSLSPDTFFPLYGLTAGEFPVGHVLSENNRKSEESTISTTTSTIAPQPKLTNKTLSLSLKPKISKEKK